MSEAATEETHQVTAEEQNQMVMAKTFDVDLIKVRVMVGEYKKMELSPGDDEQYAVCRTALTSCIRVRTGIDKRRLELNANAQDEIKARNISAKQLSEIVAPAESHLSGLIATEGARLIKIKEAEAEALKKLIDERQMALSALNCPTPYQEVAAMDEIEFDNALFAAQEDFDEAERVKAEEEEAKKAAEDARKAEVQEEADRQVIIKASQDKKDEEQRNAQKVLDAAQDKLDADRKEIDDEKQSIADAEAKRQRVIAALAKADKDKQDRLDREATEKKEATERDLKAKEREEALRPDKANMAVWIEALRHDLENTKKPHVSDAASEALVCRITDRLAQAIKYSRDEIEEL